jgi:hypothetical protein
MAGGIKSAEVVEASRLHDNAMVHWAAVERRFGKGGREDRTRADR